MRNRTNFHFTPAQGSLVYAPQQPAAAPPRVDIVNYDRLLMLLFFVVIPLLWIVSLMLSGFLWLFFLAILGTIALLWMKKGFTARGRLSMTALYAIFAVISLSTLLQGSGPTMPASRATMAPLPDNITQGSAVQLTNTQAPALNPALSDEDEDTEQEFTAPSSGGRGGNSEAEQVLKNFLENWKNGLVADMVPLTAPSWQQKANRMHNGAEAALYAQISGKKLVSYSLMSEPTGTDNDSSRAITVECKLIQKDEPRTIKYQALILKEDNKWLVDPYSLMSGTRTDLVTPGPGEVGSAGSMVTEQPTPTPKPTAKPKSNLKLYYNAKGGEFYHLEAKCSSVNKKFFPLKSFTYGNIGKSPQKNLNPCATCKAPDRP